MGTNYYWFEKRHCECCGRAFGSRHIGKSSAGWVFHVHVYPDEGINTLEDWGKLIGKEGSYIEDEYGRTVDPHDMIDCIVDRTWNGNGWTEKSLRENGAELGPNGLARAKIGRYCVGHGEGTWDYHIGDFS